MLTIPRSLKIYFCTQCTDMRKSVNGLYGVIKSFMGNDPMSGQVFVFRNRRGNMMKLFLWDGHGFVIWYKFLPKGTFKLPSCFSEPSVEVDYVTLMMIVEGIDLKSVRRQKRYQYLPAETDPQNDRY